MGVLSRKTGERVKLIGMAPPPLDLCLYSDACVLGGVDEPRRMAAARLDIRAGRLVAVTEQDRAALRVTPVGGPAVLDLGDRVVTPAFVNGHTHLAMAAFRGLQSVAALGGNVIEDLYYALESGLTADDVRAFTRLGAYESLLAGVGAVFDHYYHGEACAEALADVGLTGVICPTLQDLAGPGVTQHAAQLAGTESIATSSRLARAGVVAALGPHATDTVSGGLWRRALDLASRLGVPLHAHVAQTFDELTRCHERHGLSPIAWLDREGLLASAVPLLLVHAIYATEHDLRLLSRERHTLGLCPFSQVEFAFPANVASWQAAGLDWLIATDCAPSNDSMDVQKELRLASGMHAFAVTFSSAQTAFQAHDGAGAAASLEHLRRQVVASRAALRDPSQLLDRVWSVPGRFHPALPCGALEAGRWANLLILDPHHPSLWPFAEPWRGLALADVSPAIEGMVVAGELVGERGNFRDSIVDSAEYRAARREADERLAAHRRRLGV